MTIRDPKDRSGDTPIIFEESIGEIADLVLRQMRKDLHVGNFKFPWWNRKNISDEG